MVNADVESTMTEHHSLELVDVAGHAIEVGRTEAQLFAPPPSRPPLERRGPKLNPYLYMQGTEIPGPHTSRCQSG